jgi:hypothetical protein
MLSYRDFINRKRAEYGDKFDSSDLDARFIPFFESGQRIKVDIAGLSPENELFYGHTIKTGTVGVTTGWKPCFLLMHSSRSIGSPWTLGSAEKLLAVKRGRIYVATGH